MKKNLLICGILSVTLVVGILGSAYWLFYIPLDVERVQAIIAEVKQELKKKPANNKELLKDFGEVIKKFVEIENAPGNLALWGSDSIDVHVFYRKEIYLRDKEELEEMVANITPGLIEAYKKQTEQLGRSILIDADNPLMNNAFKVGDVISVGNFLLTYCDYLVLKERWDEIAPILESNLQVAQHLMQPPTTLFHMLLGMRLAEHTLQWYGAATQALTTQEKFTVNINKIEATIQQAGSSSTRFTDLLKCEMFYFDSVYKLINAEGKLEGSALGDFMAGFFKRDWKLTMQYYLQLLDIVENKDENTVIANALKHYEAGKNEARFYKPLHITNVSAIYDAYLKQKAFLKAVVLIPALAYYHKKFQEYPAKLTQLEQADFIAKLPDNPLDPGNTFFYILQGTGYTIYDPGDDGQDNHGDIYEDLVFYEAAAMPEIEKIDPTLENQYLATDSDVGITAPEPDIIVALPNLPLAEIIKNGPDETITTSIPKDELNRISENFDTLYTQIRAVPYFHNGAVYGLKILSVKQDSFFNHMGLKRGDVALAINGTMLDIKKGMEVYEKLKEAKMFNLLIFRGSKSLQINVNLQSPDSLTIPLTPE